MMTMCPSCYELYADIWSKPCCKCTNKTISVSAELIRAVQLLITRGFKIHVATCDTDKDIDGDIVTRVDIYFDELYPDGFFAELPPEWEICDYYHVVDGGQALERPATVLTCICVHPDDVTDSEESIAFDRLIAITNFETWIEYKDPDACKSLIVLAGCE
jgi:hypothetical protein